MDVLMTRKQIAAVVVNKVKKWCDVQGIDRQEFLAKVAEARINIGGRTLAADTILRVYDGDTNLRLQTAAAIAKALNASLDDLFE